MYFKVCPTFLGDLVRIQHFIDVYVLPKYQAAWVAIGGSCGPVNTASFIGTIVPLVVTVAINRTRSVHDQVPPDVSRLTFVMLGVLGKCTVHLILTDGSGGRLRHRRVVHNRFRIDMRRIIHNRFRIRKFL